MKYGIILIFASILSSTFASTNITGIAKGYFSLIREVVEVDGKLQPKIDWVELPTGEKRPKDTAQLFDLINKSTRVYIIRSCTDTNSLMYILATYPFPPMPAGISQMDQNIFISGNIVDLELENISETQYRQSVEGLFVYKTSFSPERRSAVYAVSNEPTLLHKTVKFYKFARINSFTMAPNNAPRENWHRFYKRYNTKVIFNHNDSQREKLFEPEH